jgi:hypothetical protein
MLRLLFALLLALCTSTFAVETCSRLAIINYQEVLVDTNSTEKGEGLRFHLEKDPLAKSYLDTYQEGTQIRWQNAVMGTVGTSMMLGGVFTNDSSRKRTMLIGGATLMIVNFLVAKTLDSANEANLIKAIEEYNKRNLPKIYFNPDLDSSKSTGPGISMAIEKSWSF